MTRIIGSLAEIATDYDVLFCDLWRLRTVNVGAQTPVGQAIFGR